MADNQYAGRGQQENSWFASPGKNLTFSMVLTPRFLPVFSQFDLVRAVSLGVFDTLEPLLGPLLKIKWPNDIYYGDRKLGGMLIENMIQGTQIKNSIIGIGLNINQETFPQRLINAVSLKQILHQDYDLKTILSEICRNIEAWYLNLKSGKTSFVRNAYKTRLYWLNENKMFKAGETTINGAITGVTDSGLLVIKNNNGGETEFSLKEIKFINKK